MTVINYYKPRKEYFTFQQFEPKIRTWLNKRTKCPMCLNGHMSTMAHPEKSHDIN